MQFFQPCSNRADRVHEKLNAIFAAFRILIECTALQNRVGGKELIWHANAKPTRIRERAEIAGGAVTNVARKKEEEERAV